MRTKYLLVLNVLLLVANLGYAWFDPLPESTATLTATPATVSVGQPVTLDGTDSYVPEGSSITEYEWDFTNDGVYDYNETPTNYADGAFDGVTACSYDANGVYITKLQITTTDEEVSTDICAVEVSGTGGGANLIEKKAIEIAGTGNSSQLKLFINHDISRFMDADPIGWIL